MRNAQEFALNAAKEITIAALHGCDNQVNGDLGDYAANYFEAVFRKVFELAKNNESEG